MCQNSFQIALADNSQQKYDSQSRARKIEMKDFWFSN